MSADGDISKTVFIRNINYKTDGKTLSEALAQFGGIASARIITGWINGQQASRGFGFVVFNTVEAFNAAIAKSRQVEVDGRSLVISASRPRNARKRDTAFVRGIPAGTTEEQIRAAFRAYNPIEIRIVRQDTADAKGFAFVKFDTEENQTKAVTDNHTIQINGAESTVRFARPPQRRFGGYRGGGPPRGRAPRGPPPATGGNPGADRGTPRRAPRGPRRPRNQGGAPAAPA
jgi:RNA recognition motif-containing protein